MSDFATFCQHFFIIFLTRLHHLSHTSASSFSHVCITFLTRLHHIYITFEVFFITCRARFHHILIIFDNTRARKRFSERRKLCSRQYKVFCMRRRHLRAKVVMMGHLRADAQSKAHVYQHSLDHTASTVSSCSIILHHLLSIFSSSFEHLCIIF